MSLPNFNQPYAIDFLPTDFLGFKTTPKDTQDSKYATISVNMPKYNVNMPEYVFIYDNNNIQGSEY